MRKITEAERIDIGRHNLIYILQGVDSLPDVMYIGNECLRHHGEDGKCLRYKSNGKCVVCSEGDNRKSQAKKCRDISALKAYELKHENDQEEDLW